MQFDVTPEKDGMMLSRLLLQVADVPQWAVRQAMKNRDVRVDGVRVSGDVRVREGQQIRVYWPKEVVASQESISRRGFRRRMRKTRLPGTAC